MRPAFPRFLSAAALAGCLCTPSWAISLPKDEPLAVVRKERTRFHHVEHRELLISMRGECPGFRRLGVRRNLSSHVYAGLAWGRNAQARPSMTADTNINHCEPHLQVRLG